MGLLDFFRRSPAPAPAPGRDVLTRRFDAIGGRRWEGSAHFGNIGTETLAAGLPVQAKARYFVANNPWAAAAVNALVAGLVGPGIRAAGSPEATAAFDAWARVADADGRTDLWGLQAAAVRGMIVDGESFTLIEETADGLRLRLLPAEQVDASRTMDLPGGATVIGGIEFDSLRPPRRLPRLPPAPDRPVRHAARDRPGPRREHAAPLPAARRRAGARRVAGSPRCCCGCASWT